MNLERQADELVRAWLKLCERDRMDFKRAVEAAAAEASYDDGDEHAVDVAILVAKHQLAARQAPVMPPGWRRARNQRIGRRRAR